MSGDEPRRGQQCLQQPWLRAPCGHAHPCCPTCTVWVGTVGTPLSAERVFLLLRAEGRSRCVAMWGRVAGTAWPGWHGCSPGSVPAKGQARGLQRSEPARGR